MVKISAIISNDNHDEFKVIHTFLIVRSIANVCIYDRTNQLNFIDWTLDCKLHSVID